MGVFSIVGVILSTVGDIMIHVGDISTVYMLGMCSTPHLS